MAKKTIQIPIWSIINNLGYEKESSIFLNSNSNMVYNQFQNNYLTTLKNLHSNSNMVYNQFAF